ncbi:MAG: hypothetical protein JW722_02945 [Demequinaceae bacterium]|nr:hypothetical protein [Demequinaceae bacterium]
MAGGFRYRVSGMNVILTVLAACLVVGVIAFFPSAPLPVRLLAGVGAVALVGVIWLILRWGVHRDRFRLSMYAAYRGWTVHPRDPGLDDRFRVFPFGSGFGGRAVNILRGPHRFHDCATFTYIVNRPAPQVYRVTMVELGTDVPSFQLLPEDLVAAVKKATGGQDHRIGHAGFDSTWRIVGDDEAFIRKVLNPGLIHSFGRRSVLGLPIAVDHGAVLTWEAGAEGVRRLSHRLDVLIEVVEAIPEEYWTGRKPRAR